MVEGFVDGWDIVAHANVLYVSEYDAKMIHRIQLSDGTSSRWSVNGERLTMSMNKKGNIVVSCQYINKIIEYTPTGSRVRENNGKVLALDRTVFGWQLGVQHAIQLDDDRFLVCYAETTQHRVCIIDSNGRMMKGYGGGTRIRDRTDRIDPCYLAIDGNGFILVADMVQQPYNTIECIA